MVITPTLGVVLSLVMSSAAASMEPGPAPARYGFVGVGVMSSAIVRGLCTLDKPPPAIVLGPRNAEKAAKLAGEFPSICKVVASNQAVVDGCDVVFIGVLPKQTEEVMKALAFTPKHTVVSLVSTAPLQLIRECSAPVPTEQVVRAIPLPPVARHRGACVMTPPHPGITALFDALGTVVPVAEEATMKKMMTVTCLMGQLYAQHRATQAWLAANGVDEEAAAKWTGAAFHAMTYDSADANSHTFNELVEEQTPGGLNEQIVREMTEAGAYVALHDSLDGAIARINGTPRANKRKRPYTSEAE